MCEKIIERIPSLTAEERVQLRHNCQRAINRSPDSLVVQEAKRVLDKLDAMEQREARVLARLPASRRIEYAFRRLPANEHERHAIRSLFQQSAPRRPELAGERMAGIAGDNIWRRHIGEMCRTRRHLLRAVQEPHNHDQPPAGDEPDALTAPLLEVDSGQGIMRLRPEAIAAFASLGYVDSSAA